MAIAFRTVHARVDILPSRTCLRRFSDHAVAGFLLEVGDLWLAISSPLDASPVFACLSAPHGANVADVVSGSALICWARHFLPLCVGLPMKLARDGSAHS